MTIDRIREAYNAAPFKPFNLHLADGRSIPVKHRDFMMAPPKGRRVVVAQPDGSLNIIDLLQVTDIELAPPKNGRRKTAKRTRK
ncbi:MAG: hypothetical protein AAF790_06260 [Planctomycetota bacterium]